MVYLLFVSLNSQVIEQVSEHRHLGVILDDQLKRQAYISSIANAVTKKMCICSLASDTFVTVKLVIPFFTRTLCLELIMSLMYGMAAVMCISQSLSLYTNVQSKC